MFVERPASAEPKSVVVVELFTSEGCSSCPSADRLLSEIVNNSYDETEVLGLSFHVDYWDYIGWKDPYAHKKFTDRQRQYAQKLRSYQLYTPQMIVNGRHEFVGSNRVKWRQVLSQEAKKKPKTNLDLQNVSVTDDQVVFEVKSDQASGMLLNIALVERELTQDVKRGENRGRKLAHDNVVRSFRVLAAPQSGGSLSIEKPEVELSKTSLMVYLQDAETFEIVAARSYRF